MLDHINQRAINACIFAAIAFIVASQYDEENRALMLDFRALAGVVIICMALFLWNLGVLCYLCWRDYNGHGHSHTKLGDY